MIKVEVRSVEQLREFSGKVIAYTPLNAGSYTINNESYGIISEKLMEFLTQDSKNSGAKGEGYLFSRLIDVNKPSGLFAFSESFFNKYSVSVREATDSEANLIEQLIQDKKVKFENLRVASGYLRKCPPDHIVRMSPREDKSLGAALLDNPML